MMRRDDPRQNVVREPRPVGGHAVQAVDDPQRDDVVVGALVAHDTHGLDRQQHREGLPDLVVEAGGLDLLFDDDVGLRSMSQLLPW